MADQPFFMIIASAEPGSGPNTRLVLDPIVLPDIATRDRFAIEVKAPADRDLKAGDYVRVTPEMGGLHSRIEKVEIAGIIAAIG